MPLHPPHSVRISGIGGQGNVLMGIILADALVSMGLWVVQTQSYGAQVRGGLSYCDVLFCKEPIDYPKANNFNVIYSMHQIAVNAHINLLKPNGILIIDSSYVSNLPKEAFRITKKIIMKPISKLTQERFGTALPSNMVGLGIISKASNIIKPEALKKAMKKHIKEKYHKLNEEAIDFGISLVEKSYTLKEESREFIRGFE
ncbi:pyruvate ferredoxin oxidoreductase [Kosmotoga arenicorallina S304]|uniref:Pyruvate ferredoxin oxidoreductase n=1 Tax=Kosmotoga arenicorallina S304 TaxID=1453497 RepID=A0A176K0X1_9BACT|nr:2-oxoacid:acceptor oxidoreductase family protein [Kosmotoga arenicorallina]OAA30120.1 pyruvate ferredoxin oxidoreductase [Kosmotoga arenicorallina S304]